MPYITNAHLFPSGSQTLARVYVDDLLPVFIYRNGHFFEGFIATFGAKHLGHIARSLEARITTENERPQMFYYTAVQPNNIQANLLQHIL